MKAKLETIAPEFFPQHEIDAEKVAALVRFMRRGGRIKPVVVVRFDDKVMPIDGHHRLAAAAKLGRLLEAWVVPGDKFDALDLRCRERRDFSRAEDFITCGGVPAMMVAPRQYGS